MDMLDEHFEGVVVDAEDDFDAENVDTFDDLVRTVRAQKERDAPPQVRAELKRFPEVADDFVRNYLVHKGLTKTLDMFETEWYESFGAYGDTVHDSVPEANVEVARLLEISTTQGVELDKLQTTISRLNKLHEEAKRERDFHRANHGRVVQEKDKLVQSLKSLQSHAANIDPTITELRGKYESLQKDKMLLKLERDKLSARVSALEEQVKEQDNNATKPASKSQPKLTQKVDTTAAAVPTFHWPSEGREVLEPTRPAANAAGWSCRSSFKAHSLTVTHVALHPKKPLVASASDDGTWRLTSVPQGDLVMSGQGHKDWVAGISMHPRGTMLATGSGDKTVKLWDFASNSCKMTLKGHTEGVWCVGFHDTGDILASGSLDHSVRIWDTEFGKSRQTLRGHVDAVNSLCWIPGSNTLCTGSGDKTVSLWDCRANHCVQTFYGHHSAVTGIAYASGNLLASCDTEGQVIVWDTRVMDQKAAFACGPHPANSVAFDMTGSLIAVASDDALIRVISLVDGKQTVLKGHDDSVQHAVFDPSSNGFLISCGSDATVRYWS